MPAQHHRDRSAWRRTMACAQLLHAWLRTFYWQRASGICRVIEELEDHHRRVLDLHRRLKHCRQRELFHMQDKHLARLQRLSQNVQYSFSTIHSVIYELRRSGPPSPRMLYHELEQLDEEFGRFQFDQKHQLLSVTTQPITLEGIALGRFTIELDIPQLVDIPGRLPFRVVAQEPNPAADNPLVTHPHVNQEKLCTGDATETVHQALIQGRITDFFLIVRGILATYNEESPYTRLEDWYAWPCSDCGQTTPDEDIFSCEDCEGRFCPSCIRGCDHCGQAICHGCQCHCADCDNPFCRTCLDDDHCPRCVQAAKEAEETAGAAGYDNNDEPTPTEPMNPRRPNHDHEQINIPGPRAHGTPGAFGGTGGTEASGGTGGTTTSHEQTQQADTHLYPFAEASTAAAG